MDVQTWEMEASKESSDPFALNHRRVKCSCGTWMLARYTLETGGDPVDFVCPGCGAVVLWSGEGRTELDVG